ncbi:MAG: 30S ribosomal protein S4 [Alphaproteobacteria bacterium]|jgi:small subunit ribosomal protein S4|nr:30S ribosomal protein S4 [Alphaproteobacteria bacterium]MBT5827599.1 30S ribosomal protein S4 [Alphaproteobacteria bacterium]
MTKRVQAKHKISRRLGVNLWGSHKYRQEKSHPPGQHGPMNSMRRKTDYGVHLNAKQKLKGYYANISEKKFRKIYQEAKSLKGDTGENIIGLLESRLDTLVYRANFVSTMFAARQFVSHKHVQVNGKTVNIPSYKLKIGDVVTIKEKSRDLLVVLETIQKKEREIPDYLEVDYKQCSAQILSLPKLSDVPYACVMEPHLIVEFYSA